MKKEQKLPEILESREVAATRNFVVEEVDLRFSNGVEVTYERLKSKAVGAVLIVPVLEERELLLIREYAVGLENYQLVFPKGRVDPGERPEDTADRELREEIGYGAGSLTPLRAVSLAPGYAAHCTQLFLATSLYPDNLAGDEPEELEVVSWPLDQIESLFLQDDFTEARSILALYLTLDQLGRGSKKGEF
ncbi:MAG: ADP compounds hydrolase NudE [Acidiferrobacteraceae bacterium]|jgi:ADP-ribose diphosphatase|nr:ADP compounds hydrolase NudE [Acidiferrobacteraceae bacterium]MDP6434822.1 ADP compounds hydrolase NudE [Arenicellales bacterium]MDP6672987.1 ADP compounds hydrolase NudE [Arenicellales bacterium]MDP6724123.1 ADP compounds hydrolase NudE [Arenicellales bacterium]|tara:strand:+ start:71222 stop:71794 length:573 start_codon:yes stop_codon:yes gene_type:complete